MPDWLVDIGKQFPIVVVIGFVGRYCSRKVDRAADKFLQREEKIRAEAAAELVEARRVALAAKDEMIRRLDAAQQGELRKLHAEARRLTKAVNELVKRLGE